MPCHKLAMDFVSVLGILATLIFRVSSETCVEPTSDFFLQLALKVDADSPVSQTLQFFQEQLRSTVLSTALQWSTLRHFPPRWQRGLDSKCANIGRRFPALVSQNLSVLEAYRHYACHVAPDYFITDPDVALTADVAALENGCISFSAKPTVVMATNGTHRYDAYRHCSGSCPDDPAWQELSVEMVDEDILVLPSTRTIPGMEYQHALTDLLAQAWTVLPLLRGSNMKLVIYSPIQGQLLQSMGIPSEQLLDIPITSLEAHKLLCVKPGRTMTLCRTGRVDGADPPFLERTDPRIYADFWWRLPGYRLGPEVSDAIARYAGFTESRPDSVVFVQRCSERRQLANEPEAVGAVTRVLVEAKSDFQLLTFCPGREDFLEQVRKVRQARLIIGEHGGALANMLLAQNGTGIIELVGSPEAQIGVPGQFPPYKSMWYGGAGAAFAFYRVVLYEPTLVGPAVRLEDLQEAVQQWLRA
ncbi:unnamed protein product [Durusdinium trenchii]|uniref:Glycosyltransferase 61 catalytic domain-containing protein n=1 Tax=Durusdinium trenchii TaxID=1381693 RepID=A0ABP0NNS5_9DINO